MIDHTTRQILIDGQGFQGVGWYVHPPGGSSIASQLANLTAQVKLGVNQVRWRIQSLSLCALQYLE